MLMVNKCRDLLDELDKTHPIQAAYVSLIVSADQNAEELLTHIKSLGYTAFIHSTTLGDEIAIVDKFSNS